MATPELFRLAMDICVDAFDVETGPDVRHHLASTALLFAQVAENLERGNPMTSAITASCDAAVSSIRDDRVRRKIEGLVRGHATQRKQSGDF